jgi:hypothetical protein
MTNMKKKLSDKHASFFSAGVGDADVGDAKNVLDGFHLVADGLLCLVAVVVRQIGPDVVKHFVFVNDG